MEQKKMDSHATATNCNTKSKFQVILHRKKPFLKKCEYCGILFERLKRHSPYCKKRQSQTNEGKDSADEVTNLEILSSHTEQNNALLEGNKQNDDLFNAYDQKWIIHLWESKAGVDVQFLVGISEKTLVSAHKFVLSMHSSIFRSMFYSEQQVDPSNIPNFGKPFEVDDINANEFISILLFLYKKETRLTGENAFGVYYAAKKYCIKDLKNSCVNFLFEHASVNDAMKVLMFADMHSEKDLFDHCLHLIDMNAHTVFEKDKEGFFELETELLCKLIKRDSLYVDELFLFECLHEWAIQQCKRLEIPETPKNKRRTVKKAIYFIRFPLIGQHEFNNIIARTEMLKKKDMIGLYLNYCNAHHSMRRSYPLKFNKNARFLKKSPIIDK